MVQLVHLFLEFQAVQPDHFHPVVLVVLRGLLHQAAQRYLMHPGPRACRKLRPDQLVPWTLEVLEDQRDQHLLLALLDHCSLQVQLHLEDQLIPVPLRVQKALRVQ